MRLSFLFLLLALAGFHLPAQITQEGMAREINSGKKPLGGVFIQFEDAPSKTTDEAGAFSLTFQNKRVGDLIFLKEIRKNGYELVNRKDFEVTKISNGERLGVDIILAKEGYVDAAKKEYYEVSDKALYASFEREKASLRRKLKEAKFTQAEYLSKLDTLQARYDIQKLNLDRLADQFARVNFDDVVPLYKKALELFKVGKVDSSMKLLEDADLIARTSELLKKKVNYEEALKETKEDIQDAIDPIRLLAELYIVEFEIQKAEALYDQLLLLDSTDLEILREVASFYEEQRIYDKALKVLPKIQSHPEAAAWQIANANVSLGDTYTTLGQLENALSAFDSARATYLRLMRDSATYFYAGNLSAVYQRLGSTYGSLGQLDSALSYYQKDLKISESLVSADPRNVGFQNGLAISYSKMGETYGSLGQLDSALSYYQQYQGLMKSLVSADPRNVGFQNGLAISYVKLGETFGSLGQLDSALSYYQKDLEISESLVSDDPRNVSFQNGLAISYVKLGEISVELGAYEEAEGYYKQAAAIWEKLVIIAPKYVEFQRFLSLIQERIQKLEDLPILILQYQIQQTQDTTQIYAYYAALVDTLRSRISQQPRYVEDLSQSLNSHAWYGLFLGAFTQAEALIQEAMALPYENVYLPINLAPALLFQGKKKEALKVYGSYRDQPFEVKTYADAFLDDMKAFEKAGIIPEAYKADVEEVKQLLSNP